MMLFGIEIMVPISRSILLSFAIFATNELVYSQTDLPSTPNNNPIVVYSSGIRPFGPSDVALQFLVSLENTGEQLATVGLEMERCCQFISQDDLDCESVVLHSGLRVQLHPKETRNLSMFYVNAYLTERSGHCWIKVHYNYPTIPGRGYEGDKIKISFDTRISEPSIFGKFWALFSKPKTVLMKCPHFDQDPKNNCLPVNCALKYSGFRSFFNKTLNKCQPSPSCLEKSKRKKEKRRPDFLLSHISNKCKDVKDIRFTENMIEVIDIVEINAASYSKFPMKVECVHGENSTATTNLNSTTTNEIGNETPTAAGWLNCTCQLGWTSSPVNNKTFNPLVDTLVLCNIRTTDGQHHDQAQMASVTFLTLFGLIIIVVILLCALLPYLYRKYGKGKSDSGYSKLPGDDDQDHEDAETEEQNSEMSILSEIKSRREIVTTPPGSNPTPTRSEILEAQSKSESHHSSTGQSKQPSPTSSASRGPSEGKSHKSLYSRFPKSLEYLPPPPKGRISRFSIPDTSESSLDLLGPLGTNVTIKPLWCPGGSKSADNQFTFPRRMGSSILDSCCDDTNQNLLEPIVKVKVISDTSEQCVCLSKNENNTNYNIASLHTTFREPTEQDQEQKDSCSSNEKFPKYQPQVETTPSTANNYGQRMFEEILCQVTGANMDISEVREPISHLNEFWMDTNESSESQKLNRNKNWGSYVWDKNNDEKK